MRGLGETEEGAALGKVGPRRHGAVAQGPPAVAEEQGRGGALLYAKSFAARASRVDC